MAKTSVAKKPKAKTSAVELTRYDYAADVAANPASMAVTLPKPHQVSVTMSTSYAAELLQRLRSVQLRRGERSQVSIDCPVEIILDTSTRDALIAQLESEVGGR